MYNKHPTEFIIEIQRALAVSCWLSTFLWLYYFDLMKAPKSRIMLKDQCVLDYSLDPSLALIKVTICFVLNTIILIKAT